MVQLWLTIQIPIYARSVDLEHLLELKTVGATDAILEATEVPINSACYILRYIAGLKLTTCILLKSFDCDHSGLNLIFVAVFLLDKFATWFPTFKGPWCEVG
jgi:hypothetical protein